MNCDPTAPIIFTLNASVVHDTNDSVQLYSCGTETGNFKMSELHLKHSILFMHFKKETDKIKKGTKNSLSSKKIPKEAVVYIVHENRLITPLAYST